MPCWCQETRLCGPGPCETWTTASASLGLGLPSWKVKGVRRDGLYDTSPLAPCPPTKPPTRGLQTSGWDQIAKVALSTQPGWK